MYSVHVAQKDEIFTHSFLQQSCFWAQIQFELLRGGINEGYLEFE